MDEACRRPGGALLPFRVDLGGIGPPLFFQQDEVQGHLHAEVRGPLLHPAVDGGMDRIVQQQVEQVSGGKAALGSVPMPQGLGKGR